MKKLLLILPLLFLSLYAKDIAFAKKVKGEVSASENGKTTIVKQSDWLCEKMIVTTGDRSGITLIFKDNSVLVLGSNSILKLEKYIFEANKKNYKIELSLDKGSLSFESGKIGELSPENFIFKTPEATVGIRGTKFMVKLQ